MFRVDINYIESTFDFSQTGIVSDTYQTSTLRQKRRGAENEHTNNGKENEPSSVNQPLQFHQPI